MNVTDQLSIVIPAKNEATNLAEHLDEVRALYPSQELIVVNDGSSDDTGEIAESAGAIVVNHPYSMGNGAAIKSGARAASEKYILFLDADGQHNPSDIPKLISEIEKGHKMVIGARESTSHASKPRRYMNFVYNRIASLITGFRIDDLTSGFRIVEARYFRQFLYLLPNGFSYPTTITMAFLRSGLAIKYIPIVARKREGRSNINPMKDGLRFLVIILKIGALFSPMRLFLPISLALFVIGILYYAYTFITQFRFTNMGAVLLLSALVIFLIGILSEQISSLHYQVSQKDDESES